MSWRMLEDIRKVSTSYQGARCRSGSRLATSLERWSLLCLRTAVSERSCSTERERQVYPTRASKPRRKRPQRPSKHGGGILKWIFARELSSNLGEPTQKGPSRTPRLHLSVLLLAGSGRILGDTPGCCVLSGERIRSTKDGDHDHEGAELPGHPPSGCQDEGPPWSRNRGSVEAICPVPAHAPGPPLHVPCPPPKVLPTFTPAAPFHTFRGSEVFYGTTPQGTVVRRHEGGDLRSQALNSE